MTRLAAAALAVVLLGAPLAVRLGAGPYALSVATHAAVLAIGAVSLQFALRFGGLVSFGHAAMLGVGAYTVLLSGSGDVLWTLPLAMAAAGAFAFVTGLIALRAEGVTFLMITLAFGQMAFFVAGSLAPYGGDDGMPLDARSTLAGCTVFENRTTLHYAVVASLALLLIALRILARSRFGTVLRAASENAARVTALSYDVRRIRLAAYAISGAGGGLCGFWLANYAEFVSPAVMDWRNSGQLLIMVILGRFGRGVDGALIGAAFAAVALVVAEEALALVTAHWPLLLGPALVLLALRRRA